MALRDLPAGILRRLERMGFSSDEQFRILDLRQGTRRGGGAVRIGEEISTVVVVDSLDPKGMPPGLELAPKPRGGWGLKPRSWAESSGDKDAVPVSDWIAFRNNGLFNGTGQTTPVDADGNNVDVPSAYVVGQGPASKLAWQIGRVTGSLAATSPTAAAALEIQSATSNLDVVGWAIPAGAVGNLVPITVSIGSYVGMRITANEAIEIDVSNAYGYLQFLARVVRILT